MGFLTKITPTDVHNGISPESKANLSRHRNGGPLAALDNSLTLALFNYPLDLNSNNKRHYVKFWIKEIIQGGTEGAVAGGGTGKVFGLSVSPRVTNPVAAIALYMPDTLNASYNASYDELSLTSEAGVKINTLQKIGSAMQSFGDKNPASSVGVDPAVASLVSSALGVIAGAAGAGENVADINLQAAGFTINPQLQMIYRGVAFRHFQLTFTFTPSSKQESELVKAIIETFKVNFAPSIHGEGNADNIGMFFTPPSVFNVDFMIDTGLNQYLPKYGDCVLTDIDVNYAPNGFAPHADGSPVQTQLNLTFKEIEIVTQKKLGTPLTGGSNGTDGGLR
jgi:hypothetical protein